MNKKTVSFTILFLLLCAYLWVVVAVDERIIFFTESHDGRLDISLLVQSCKETIKPFYNEKDDTYYYFLPSSIWEDIVYADSSTDNLLVDGKKISLREGFRWTDEQVHKLSNKGVEKNIRFMQSSDIGAIFISTESGSTSLLDADKKHIESGKIDVIESDGTISYSGELTLRGRGNSTFRKFTKKPYNIKLESAAGILSMEPDKDFSLLANSWDYSYMNNMLAFDMGEKAGFNYVPQTEYADVWINGDYWGIYLVTETCEVDKDRIDITDLEEENKRVNPEIDVTKAESFDYGDKRGVYLDELPADITGGYLIERDYRLDSEYINRNFTTSYFETEDYQTCLNIKSPEYAAKEEVDYISSLVNEMEQAFVSADGYSDQGKYYLDYIDLDSWVKWYMIGEIAHDLDKGATNTYIYKDRDSIDSKFYAGPIWDYDCRFGGTYQHATSSRLSKLPNGWNEYLYDKTEFYEEVKKNWNIFFEEYLRVEAPENIDKWQELIRKSVEMDNVRWDRSTDYPVRWPGVDDSRNFVKEYVFDDQVNHLKNWIGARREFLDKYWGD